MPTVPVGGEPITTIRLLFQGSIVFPWQTDDNLLSLSAIVIAALSIFYNLSTTAGNGSPQGFEIPNFSIDLCEMAQ